MAGALAQDEAAWMAWALHRHRLFFFNGSPGWQSLKAERREIGRLLAKSIRRAWYASAHGRETHYTHLERI
jgi:hypothetical protein